ncbi:MAG: hypothetical protein J7J72_00705, partial [Bacteroidales bacterium]|nr:hypothetical protein [Bacteroidales bacterium]
MKRNKIGLLSLFFIAFLTSCLSDETKDNQTEEQNIYSQMGSDSTKSDPIRLILTKIVADDKAPGMIA